MPNLLAEFKCYKDLSDFHFNYQTSEALNLTIPTKISNLQTNLHFKWASPHIKYLGILLPSNLSTLYTINFSWLLSEFHSELSPWSSCNFSWTSRCNVLKQNVLPRILYLFQTIPTKIPASFFQTLQSIFNKFGLLNPSGLIIQLSADQKI